MVAAAVQGAHDIVNVDEELRASVKTKGRKRHLSDLPFSKTGVKVVVRNSFVNIVGNESDVEGNETTPLQDRRAMSDNEVDYSTLEEQYSSDDGSDLERGDTHMTDVTDVPSAAADEITSSSSPMSSDESNSYVEYPAFGLSPQGNTMYQYQPDGTTVAAADPSVWSGLWPVIVSWWPMTPFGWVDQMPQEGVASSPMYDYWGDSNPGPEQGYLQHRGHSKGKMQRRRPSLESDSHLAERAVAEITAQLIEYPNHTGRVWIPEWRDRYGLALGSLRQFAEDHPKFQVIPGDRSQYTIALIEDANGSVATCQQIRASSSAEEATCIEESSEWPELVPAQLSQAPLPIWPVGRPDQKCRGKLVKEGQQECQDSASTTTAGTTFEESREDKDDDWTSYLVESRVPRQCLPPAPSVPAPSLPPRSPSPRRLRQADGWSLPTTSPASLPDSPIAKKTMSQPTTSPVDSLETMSPAEDNDVDYDDGDWSSFVCDTAQPFRSPQIPIAPDFIPPAPRPAPELKGATGSSAAFATPKASRSSREVQRHRKFQEEAQGAPASRPPAAGAASAAAAAAAATPAAVETRLETLVSSKRDKIDKVVAETASLPRRRNREAQHTRRAIAPAQARFEAASFNSKASIVDHSRAQTQTKSCNDRRMEVMKVQIRPSNSAWFGSRLLVFFTVFILTAALTISSFGKKSARDENTGPSLHVIKGTSSYAWVRELPSVENYPRDSVALAVRAVDVEVARARVIAQQIQAEVARQKARLLAAKQQRRQQKKVAEWEEWQAQQRELYEQHQRFQEKMHEDWLQHTEAQRILASSRIQTR
jgi:hypothetical protein